MNKNEKSEAIKEVVELINESSAVYLTDYSGIKVEDINKLRKEFRKEGVKYKVLKNTFFERALKETGKYPQLSNYLVGMTSVIFAYENPVAPAKIIKKYFDDKQKLSLKACYIDSAFYDGKQLNDLASLPTKPEIIAGILGSLDSPISGVVGAINAVMRDLVIVIDEISKKEAA
ncbi:MAG: 50S ribosomal protein L10 [Chlorobiaceae bacterium]|nr:50S ribosomal protein L10 [Chlorobiaceae bacterium]MBA4310162.1 50S ribosomal protein L10 [Chlorobiaceae bacterium]